MKISNAQLQIEGVKSNYHFLMFQTFVNKTGALMDYEMHYADGREMQIRLLQCQKSSGWSGAEAFNQHTKRPC
jgi:hypothetical protein